MSTNLDMSTYVEQRRKLQIEHQENKLAVLDRFKKKWAKEGIYDMEELRDELDRNDNVREFQKYKLNQQFEIGWVNRLKAFIKRIF